MRSNSLESATKKQQKLRSKALDLDYSFRTEPPISDLGSHPETAPKTETALTTGLAAVMDTSGARSDSAGQLEAAADEGRAEQNCWGPVRCDP